MSLAVALRHDFGGFTLAAEFSAPGGVTALFGASGAGKSSIVAAVAGLFRPDEARITVNARMLTATDERIFVPPHRRRAAMVFQEPRLFPHLSVRSNLLYGWRRTGMRAKPDEIEALVALLGLENLQARKPGNLSGGEKARVALGRALLSAPDILLLDEPLASLDGPRRGEILPYLEKLRGTVPMLYVSHDAGEVARLADHVVLLDGGRVTGAGAPGEMLLGHGGIGGVIEAVCLGAREDGLAELAFDNGRLALAADIASGTRLRLRIAADDILLARVKPQEISANNVLRVTVAEVRIAGMGADILLEAGAAGLLARITAASARRLALVPGLPVFAIIKSVIVESGIPAAATG